MKKNLIILVIISLTFFSCQDAIDIQQAGELTEEAAIQSVDDLELNLQYVYRAASIRSQIALSSIWTDEVGIGYDNGGQGISDGQYNFQMTTGSSFASGIWNSNYDLINFANRLITEAKRIEPETEEDEERYNDILGQARALRAFGHFQLMTYFAVDMTDDNSLGVILLDYVPEITDQPGRNSTGEVFSFINDDLDFAENNLSSNTDVTYVTSNFITAMRARIALYRENYADAQTYAQQLINAVPLSNPSTYRDIWRDEAAGEVIFKLERTANDEQPSIASLWQSIDNTISGSSFYEVGRALFNLLDENDVRYDVIVGNQSIIDPNYENSPNYRNSDILLINKYPGSEGLRLVNDLKVFRVSEMYLIKAEAQINSGNLSGAAQTIQEIVEARYTTGAPSTPSYSNDTEAWKDVLQERRIELAFEGHRYIDMRRLDSKANAQFDRNPRDCEAVSNCTLPIDSYKLILPIPGNEINANTGIENQQNPGY